MSECFTTYLTKAGYGFKDIIFSVTTTSIQSSENKVIEYMKENNLDPKEHELFTEETTDKYN